MNWIGGGEYWGIKLWLSSRVKGAYKVELGSELGSAYYIEIDSREVR